MLWFVFGYQILPNDLSAGIEVLEDKDHVTDVDEDEKSDAVPHTSGKHCEMMWNSVPVLLHVHFVIVSTHLYPPIYGSFLPFSLLAPLLLCNVVTCLVVKVSTRVYTGLSSFSH